MHHVAVKLKGVAIMANMTKLPALALAALLSACAGLGGPPPAPGDSMETVQSKMGVPSAIHNLPSGTQYEYSGPYAQHAHMARFNPEGKLVSFEQVRTGQRFATLKPGVATKADVLASVGQPSETSRVHMHNYEVWSYRYKENDVWNSMMHVHFDQNGVVQLMQSGPDPMFEDKKRF